MPEEFSAVLFVQPEPHDVQRPPHLFSSPQHQGERGRRRVDSYLATATAVPATHEEGEGTTAEVSLLRESRTYLLQLLQLTSAASPSPPSPSTLSSSTAPTSLQILLDRIRTLPSLQQQPQSPLQAAHVPSSSSSSPLALTSPRSAVNFVIPEGHRCRIHGPFGCSCDALAFLGFVLRCLALTSYCTPSSLCHHSNNNNNRRQLTPDSFAVVRLNMLPPALPPSSALGANDRHYWSLVQEWMRHGAASLQAAMEVLQRSSQSGRRCDGPQKGEGGADCDVWGDREEEAQEEDDDGDIMDDRSRRKRPAAPRRSSVTAMRMTPQSAGRSSASTTTITGSPSRLTKTTSAPPSSHPANPHPYHVLQLLVVPETRLLFLVRSGGAGAGGEGRDDGGNEPQMIGPLVRLKPGETLQSVWNALENGFGASNVAPYLVLDGIRDSGWIDSDEEEVDLGSTALRAGRAQARTTRGVLVMLAASARRVVQGESFPASVSPLSSMTADGREGRSSVGSPSSSSSSSSAIWRFAQRLGHELLCELRFVGLSFLSPQSSTSSAMKKNDSTTTMRSGTTAGASSQSCQQRKRLLQEIQPRPIVNRYTAPVCEAECGAAVGSLHELAPCDVCCRRVCRECLGQEEGDGTRVWGEEEESRFCVGCVMGKGAPPPPAAAVNTRICRYCRTLRMQSTPTCCVRCGAVALYT